MNKQLHECVDIRDFLISNYEPVELQDICSHGCGGGVSYLTYYSETVAFYQRFDNEIWDMAFNDFSSLGHSNQLEMFASFNGAKDVGSMEQFENLLAWYAVEEVARQIVGESDSDNLCEPSGSVEVDE